MKNGANGYLPEKNKEKEFAIRTIWDTELSIVGQILLIHWVTGGKAVVGGCKEM